MMPKIFHKCSYVKCKTNLPGLFIPVATFLPAPVGDKPVPKYMPRGQGIMSDLRLCESCALTAHVHEMVNDVRWTEICKQIAASGGSPPDRDSLELMLATPNKNDLDRLKTIRKLRGPITTQ